MHTYGIYSLNYRWQYLFAWYIFEEDKWARMVYIRSIINSRSQLLFVSQLVSQYSNIPNDNCDFALLVASSFTQVPDHKRSRSPAAHRRRLLRRGGLQNGHRGRRGL